MRRRLRLTESDLHKIVSKSVKRILKETELYYDVDNFSGRHTKNPNYDDYVDPEGYLDDPYNAPNSWDDEEWIDNDKDMENEYSWKCFDNKSIAHGTDDFYSVSRQGVPKDVDKAIEMRNREKYFTDRENTIGRRQMRGYVRGTRDPEDF